MRWLVIYFNISTSHACVVFLKVLFRYGHTRHILGQGKGKNAKKETVGGKGNFTVFYNFYSRGIFKVFFAKLGFRRFFSAAGNFA